MIIISREAVVWRGADFPTTEDASMSSFVSHLNFVLNRLKLYYWPHMRYTVYDGLKKEGKAQSAGLGWI